MKRRKLNREELELWLKAMEDARPLASRPAPQPRPLPKPVAVQPVRQDDRGQPPHIPAFRLGERARELPTGDDLSQSLPQRIAAAPLAMDKKAFGRMKRGKVRPEGKLDLHGMTLERAHGALRAFILGAYARDARLVLVVTGKGREGEDAGPIPRRIGALRHEVPHWLSSAPLSEVVLQVSQAHLRHGGGGAYYVYLRKRR